MGDDETRDLQTVERTLDCRFSLQIEVAAGFIQHEDFGARGGLHYCRFAAIPV